MTIHDRYRRVRNRIRRLGVRDSLDVIWAYAQYLQVNGFEFPRDIEVADQFRNADLPQRVIAEWTFEQLAREVIRHAGEEPDRGVSLRRWETLARVVTELRQLEDRIYGHLVGAQMIHLELMRISHRQFVWQQQRLNWRWIIRYYKLFNTPDLRPICFEATGLNLDEIYLIGMVFLGHFFRRPRTVENMDIQIPGLERMHIDSFLQFTCLGRVELANKLRDEHALDESFAYRYSSIREFPLVRFTHAGRREISCPIPTLLFWRITTGLYYSLHHVAGFPTAFGRSFQDYTGAVLAARIANPGMAVLGEAEYQVGRHRKHTVDYIIQHGDDAALFVECKTMRLTWASKAGLADLGALDQDVRKLAGAVIQVYKTINDYRHGRYPNLAYVAERQIYPAVVTLEDWYFFGLGLPVRLEAAVQAAMRAAGLPAEWLVDMPYSIMSIDEFEKASGVLNAVGVRPFVSGKVNDAECRHWAYGSYCNDRYRDQVAAQGHLFLDEYDALFAGVVE